jgi:hypothetical protein
MNYLTVCFTFRVPHKAGVQKMARGQKILKILVVARCYAGFVKTGKTLARGQLDQCVAESRNDWLSNRNFEEGSGHFSIRALGNIQVLLRGKIFRDEEALIELASLSIRDGREIAPRP